MAVALDPEAVSGTELFPAQRLLEPSGGIPVSIEIEPPKVNLTGFQWQPVGRCIPGRHILITAKNSLGL
jgi:hypothetical protein